MTHCLNCRDVIDDSTQVKCDVCDEPMHKRCAVECGMANRDNENCGVYWCTPHAIRRPTCCYPDDGSTEVNFETGEAPHEHAAPLCHNHIRCCNYCRFAVCSEHADLEIGRDVDFGIVECKNCGFDCCSLHWVWCEECDQECVVCAGLSSDDEGSEWSKIYEGNYQCKTHRYIAHKEVDLTPPDSPAGEPMTRATKSRLRK